MPLLILDEVSYTYHGSTSPALSGLSLSVESGEYLALIGANGSGKSTLLRLLDGLRVPSAGRVLVDGMDAADPALAREIRARVALVFQSPADQIVSTIVEEDVAFGPENLSLPREEIGRRVNAALRAVGLESERKRPCAFLSAGQQQRLALAGALAMEPLCIAFDEATSMLDPAGRIAVLDLMDALAERGIAVLHVTHDMDEAARATRVVVLDEGRIIFDGPPESLFAAGSQTESLRALGLPKAASAALALGLEVLPREGCASLAARIIDALGGPAFARAALAASLPSRAPPGAASTRATGVTWRSPGAGELSDAGPGGVPGADRALGPAFALESASHSYLRGTIDESLGVEGLSLSLPRGSLVALVGRTGSGKSTALQLMDGLVSADRGRVRSLGEDLAEPGADLRRARMRAPLAIQRPESALFETYAGDDVAFGPRNQGLKGKALVARVRDAMGETGLDFDSFRDRRVRSLSGGEKRKLALAGVLAMEPEALLLDEPGSALDPPARRAVASLIRARAGGGRTVVMATHDMEAAAEADLLVVLDGGRLAAFGPPAEIFRGEGPELWGISLPFACELARELESSGLPLEPFPMSEAALAAVLAPALIAARARS